jgi:hypothetical protein
MAKALLGYVGGDARLIEDNRRLRRRVEDLESVVLRLQAENDALAAQLTEADLLVISHNIGERAVTRA